MLLASYFFIVPQNKTHKNVVVVYDEYATYLSLELDINES